MHTYIHMHTGGRERQAAAGLDVQDRVLDAMNKKAISTGFRYYVMLRTITDYETEPNTALDKLFDMSIPAIAYYDKGTACLEVCMHMCVCIYVRACVCVCGTLLNIAYVHTYIHAYIHTHTHTNMQRAPPSSSDYIFPRAKNLHADHL